jgi:hypothetical protein
VKGSAELMSDFSGVSMSGVSSESKQVKLV